VLCRVFFGLQFQFCSDLAGPCFTFLGGAFRLWKL